MSTEVDEWALANAQVMDEGTHNVEMFTSEQIQHTKREVINDMVDLELVSLMQDNPVQFHDWMNRPDKYDAMAETLDKELAVALLAERHTLRRTIEQEKRGTKADRKRLAAIDRALCGSASIGNMCMQAVAEAGEPVSVARGDEPARAKQLQSAFKRVRTAAKRAETGEYRGDDALAMLKEQFGAETAAAIASMGPRDAAGAQTEPVLFVNHEALAARQAARQGEDEGKRTKAKAKAEAIDAAKAHAADPEAAKDVTTALWMAVADADADVRPDRAALVQMAAMPVGEAMCRAIAAEYELSDGDYSSALALALDDDFDATFDADEFMESNFLRTSSSASWIG